MSSVRQWQKRAMVESLFSLPAWVECQVLATQADLRHIGFQKLE
jgi:hypothetical protein